MERASGMVRRSETERQAIICLGAFEFLFAAVKANRNRRIDLMEERRRIASAFPEELREGFENFEEN